MFKLDLEKAEEPEIKLPTSIGSSKKQGDSRKSIYFYFTDYAKAGLWIALAVWITTNCGNLFKSWEYQTTLPASWDTCMQVRKQQLEPGMKNRLVPNWERSMSSCILSPWLFNLYAEYITWNAGLDETQVGIKIAERNMNDLRYADDTILMAESEEVLRSFLMKVKEKSEKVGLKGNIQKVKIIVPSPITSWQIDGEIMKTVTDFIFLGSKITVDGDRSHEIERRLLLGRKAMTNLDSILKSRDITWLTKVCIVKASFSSNHVWMWELDHKESWVPKNWCFHIPQAMRQSQEKSYILYNPIFIKF